MLDLEEVEGGSKGKGLWGGKRIVKKGEEDGGGWWRGEEKGGEGKRMVWVAASEGARQPRRETKPSA